MMNYKLILLASRNLRFAIRYFQIFFFQTESIEQKYRI